MLYHKTRFATPPKSEKNLSRQQRLAVFQKKMLWQLEKGKPPCASYSTLLAEYKDELKGLVDDTEGQMPETGAQCLER